MYLCVACDVLKECVSVLPLSFSIVSVYIVCYLSFFLSASIIPHLWLSVYWQIAQTFVLLSLPGLCIVLLPLSACLRCASCARACLPSADGSVCLFLCSRCEYLRDGSRA